VAAIFLALATNVALLFPFDAAAVLFCPSGVHVFSEDPLPLKAFRKQELLRIALPYRRDDWELDGHPFPNTQVAAIEVCLDGVCEERPKPEWNTHWDNKSKTLWINLEHYGPLKHVRVRLFLGEGECGGYLTYEAKNLPW